MIPEAGRGVFAGRYYDKHEFIETSMALPIPINATRYSTQLSNYVFATDNQDFPIFLFGAAMIYNSHANQSVKDTSPPPEEF